MADKRFLTDRFLRALPPAPPRTRLDIWDAAITGFGVRVYDDKDPMRRGKAGVIRFILYARFPSQPYPARRIIGVYAPLPVEEASSIIGTYPVLTLEEARGTALEWRGLVARGIDPSVIAAKAREQAEREAALLVQCSFGSICEDFIADKLRGERSGRHAERQLRDNFIKAWAQRPINEITTLDVLSVVNHKKRTAPKMAGALLVLIRRCFAWIIDQQVYGLTVSPCDRLSVVKIIGAPQSRSRRLNDAEIFAFWRATGRMPYPVGPVYRTLLLTGLRLNEAARISRSEIHGNDTIVIPASRMKGKGGRAVEHLVPASSALQEVIASLPRIGSYLFSYNGKQPMTMNGTLKAELDRRMLITLKALARKRGEDYRAVNLPAWVNHDLRRTVRTALSALRVEHNVAESVLAHRASGVVATYNLHQFEDEKREALEKWSNHIASIVNPPEPATVIALPRRRR